MTEKDAGQQSPADRHSNDVPTNEPTTVTSAKVSTGPRTAEGKANASKNAIKHGIYSSAMLLKSESRSDYDSLLTGFWEYFKPVGMFEEFLVEKLVVLSWRHRRLVITEKDEIENGGLSLVLVVGTAECPGSFPALRDEHRPCLRSDFDSAREVSTDATGPASRAAHQVGYIILVKLVATQGV